MSNVIKFQRYQIVTDWPLTRIREWVREQGWKAFTIHLPQTDTDPVMIERLPG